MDLSRSDLSRIGYAIGYIGLLGRVAVGDDNRSSHRHRADGVAAIRKGNRLCTIAHGDLGAIRPLGIRNHHIAQSNVAVIRHCNGVLNRIANGHARSGSSLLGDAHTGISRNQRVGVGLFAYRYRCSCVRNITFFPAAFFCITSRRTYSIGVRNVFPQRRSQSDFSSIRLVQRINLHNGSAVIRPSTIYNGKGYFALVLIGDTVAAGLRIILIVPVVQGVDQGDGNILIANCSGQLANILSPVVDITVVVHGDSLGNQCACVSSNAKAVRLTRVAELCIRHIILKCLGRLAVVHVLKGDRVLRKLFHRCTGLITANLLVANFGYRSVGNAASLSIGVCHRIGVGDFRFGSNRQIVDRPGTNLAIPGNITTCSVCKSTRTAERIGDGDIGQRHVAGILDLHGVGESIARLYGVRRTQDCSIRPCNHLGNFDLLAGLVNGYVSTRGISVGRNAVLKGNTGSGNIFCYTEIQGGFARLFKGQNIARSCIQGNDVRVQICTHILGALIYHGNHTCLIRSNLNLVQDGGRAARNAGITTVALREGYIVSALSVCRAVDRNARRSHRGLGNGNVISRDNRDLFIGVERNYMSTIQNTTCMVCNRLTAANLLSPARCSRIPAGHVVFACARSGQDRQRNRGSQVSIHVNIAGSRLSAIAVCIAGMVTLTFVCRTITCYMAIAIPAWIRRQNISSRQPAGSRHIDGSVIIRVALQSRCATIQHTIVLHVIRSADIDGNSAAALDVVGLVRARVFRDSGAHALAEDQVGINGLDHIAGFGRKIDVLAVIEGLGIGDLSVAVGARVPVTRIVARAGGTLVGFHGDISINGGTCISIRDNLDRNRTSHRILDRRLRQRYGDIVRLSFQNIARGAGNALDIVGSAVRTGQRRVNLGQIRSKFGVLADLYPLVCNWVHNLNWSTLSILVRNRQCCGVKDRCRNRECDFLIPTAILIIQSRLAIQRNLIMTRLYGLVFDLNRIRQGDCTVQSLRVGPVNGVALNPKTVSFAFW